jgi:hypothetical protein
MAYEHPGVDRRTGTAGDALGVAPLAVVVAGEDAWWWLLPPHALRLVTVMAAAKTASDSDFIGAN